MKTYLYNNNVLFDDVELETARLALGVSANADGQEIKAAYLDRLPIGCIEDSSQITEDDLLILEKLNRSLEMLVTYGNIKETSAPSMIIVLRINSNGEVERVKDDIPHFSFDCWDPEINCFDHFVRNYQDDFEPHIKERINGPLPVGWHKGLYQYFLPYHCLNKLVDGRRRYPSDEDIDQTVYSSITFSQEMDKVVNIWLLLPSKCGRSNNIEMMTVGSPLKWRNMVESEFYPYNIEISSLDGKSLGEIPRHYACCLTPLLEKGLIEINATVAEIEHRKNRGTRARCSYMSIALHIRTTGKPIIEHYF